MNLKAISVEDRVPSVFCIVYTDLGELKFVPDTTLTTPKQTGKFYSFHNEWKQPNIWYESVQIKKLGEGFVKGVLNQYNQEKISFSKMVELMNEEFFQYKTRFPETLQEVKEYEKTGQLPQIFNEDKKSVSSMLSRQLSDRIETYLYLIYGQCKCGQPIVKVWNSSVMNGGDRYHYPDDNSAWNIFRCKSCLNPIHKTFNAK